MIKIHRNRFLFTNFSKRRIQENLSSKLQEIFFIKLYSALKNPEFSKMLKPLKGLEPATHYVNLGHDRLILRAVKNHVYIVLDVENRRERV